MTGEKRLVVDRKTISIMQACELVGVSRRTIYNWIARRQGRVRAHRRGARSGSSSIPCGADPDGTRPTGGRRSRAARSSGGATDGRQDAPSVLPNAEQRRPGQSRIRGTAPCSTDSTTSSASSWPTPSCSRAVCEAQDRNRARAAADRHQRHRRHQHRAGHPRPPRLGDEVARQSSPDGSARRPAKPAGVGAVARRRPLAAARAAMSPCLHRPHNRQPVDAHARIVNTMTPAVRAAAPGCTRLHVLSIAVDN